MGSMVQHNRTQHTRSHGYTLLEVIVVLVLLGLLALVATSSNNQGNSQAFMMSERIKQLVRYSQMQALATESEWGVRSYVVGTETRLTLFNNASQDVPPPGARRNGAGAILTYVSVPAEAGVITPFTVHFDATGAPHNGNIGSAELAADLVLSIGGGTANLTIRPVTGYVS